MGPYATFRARKAGRHGSQGLRQKACRSDVLPYGPARGIVLTPLLLRALPVEVACFSKKVNGFCSRAVGYPSPCRLNRKEPERLFEIGRGYLGDPGIVIGGEARFLLQGMN